MQNKTLLFRDRPLFGLDISQSGIHVMQLKRRNKGYKVVGYGEALLDSQALNEGVVKDPGKTADAIKQLLKSAILGDINASRVAISIPAERTFSRAVTLPKLNPKQLHEAIMLETEQYTPVAIDNLYVDYTPIQPSSPGQYEYFVVAAPRPLVDSYLQAVTLAGLEPVLVETHVDSTHRLFAQTDFGTIPSVVIDFHPNSADISIIDKDVVATGTVSLGKIPVVPAKLNTSTKQLEPAQPIAATIAPSDPQLELLLKEVRRMIRYYQDRYDKTHKIEQIVLLGNELALPGIAGLMTDQLRLPVRSADPWQLFEFDAHSPELPADKKDDYIVAAGLAATPFKKVLT